MGRARVGLALWLVGVGVGLGWWGVAGALGAPAGGRDGTAQRPAVSLEPARSPDITQPLTDTQPAVAAVWPAPEAQGVALEATLVITFTEPVALAAGALELDCERSGPHPLSTGGGPTVYVFTPVSALAAQERCLARLRAEAVVDLDEPPQVMRTEYAWAFESGSWAVFFNELDAITVAGGAEFVEIYDGGHGDRALSGLSVVLYDGDSGSVFLAFGLDGYRTDSRGYFVIGTAASPGVDLLIADGVLLDSPAAVALYDAPPGQFPPGTPVVTDLLVDALVYGPAGEALLALLRAGEPPVDEQQRDQALTDAVGRCPNGAGRPRTTTAYRLARPTPDGANDCPIDPPDDAPRIVDLQPPDGARRVSPDVTLQVTFSEPVTVASDGPVILCEGGAPQAYSMSGEGTTFRLRPQAPLPRGQQCSVTIPPAGVHDLDTDDPPDILIDSLPWTFDIAPPVAQGLAINEVDADTQGVDAAEFIELYDGGRGETALDGLSLVLFNGAEDVSYRTVDLSGHATDGDGYFVAGNEAVIGRNLTLPEGFLQNGPDAVALVAGDAAAVPNGTPVSAVTPIDAVVYGHANEPDTGLLQLLNTGQPQIDEDGRDDGEAHSNQRCPNGSGGARNTAGFRQNTPTPGAVNDCITDTAPKVIERTPAPDATGVSLYSPIQLTFSEPVTTRQDWATITCSLSGNHDYVKSGDAVSFTLAPLTPFIPSERCTVSLKARYISDRDTDDPPDKLAGNLSWHFSTTAPVADFVVLNELDSDTPSSDTAEFVELFDGGRGLTDLTGLSLVFFNGYTKSPYFALDLDGHFTNAAGYWLAGNAAINPALPFPDGTLQNGPDAVALYAADAAQFDSETPPTTLGLLDAVAYGDPDDVPAELLALLLPGAVAIDEAAGGASDRHALQRCPNGSGGQRRTAAFLANTPSPGAPSNCARDDAPRVVQVTPSPDATKVAATAALTVTFSEPVAVDTGWLSLSCATSGQASLSIQGGPLTFRATPSPLAYGEECDARIAAGLVHDLDAIDPPDQLTADFGWTFTTTAPPAKGILINELDADTPGSDTAEFIELTDGGTGNTSLAGLVLVFFNGRDDSVYYALDLVDARTNAAGLVVIGGTAVPGGAVTLPPGVLQNGPDAVALYEGNAADFPSGTAVTVAGLRDAVVYGTGDPPDEGLLALLEPGEVQVDEDVRGMADHDASQRCPDGAGGPRRTAAYRPGSPTPGSANHCTNDQAPGIVAVSPPNGAADVATGTGLTVDFTEAVILDALWYAIDCSNSGQHEAETTGGPTRFTLRPLSSFTPGETCTVTLHGPAIHDADGDDPPDTLVDDFAWRFTIAISSPPDGVLINEMDSDTPGSDAAEFIELYDGGRGHTDLSGLVVVFWNGHDDAAYRAIDLFGRETNAAGYFVLGNAALSTAGITFPDGTLQNGPDAVGLYAGRAADFPSGTSLSLTGLRDAVVYGPASTPDGGLLPLLLTGQPQVDETLRGAADRHALQRCPNGSGDPRATAAIQPGTPSPGAANPCDRDEPPAVVSVTPRDGATGVRLTDTLSVTFSEPVFPTGDWFRITCDHSGDHAAAVDAGPEHFDLTPISPFNPGERCRVTLNATAIHDDDDDDPPDQLAADVTWAFETLPLAATGILINELDADTPGSDTAEFIELFDGGAGGTPLTGLALVFFNGHDDRVYYAVDLSDLSTGPAGLVVVGGADVAGHALTLPPGVLQNGADAVALYEGQAADFPSGTAITTAGLRDAIVYGTGDTPDNGLLALLEPGEAQVDEAARGTADLDASQRCPDGAGGPRRSVAYRPGAPTPGNANYCPVDQAPAVASVSPPDGADNVSTTATLVIEFTEDVTFDVSWYEITCSVSGRHDVGITGGPATYTLKPLSPFAPAELCAVALRGAAVHDADADDPPDTAADFLWRFTLAPAPPAGMLLNELDADTPGRDTAEFLELYDGGAGHTDLTGLAVVLWNGKSDSAYGVVDLNGRRTDAGGFFVLGDDPLGDLPLPGGALQNGTDAVALVDLSRVSPHPGDPLTTDGLLDALVYGPTGALDDGLIVLLAAGQSPRDEAESGSAAAHALQRCPDGAGGPRHTAAYVAAPPSPGRANTCAVDAPPAILATWPLPDAVAVPLTTTLRIIFSEPVDADGGWVSLACDPGGEQALAERWVESTAELLPTAPLPSGATCTTTVRAAALHDHDIADPPDSPAAGHTWRFATAPPPPVVAAFASNSPVLVGDPVVFRNLSTGPGPLGFSWVFGDGTVSTAAAPTHRYPAAGRYTVTLSVIGPTTATARGEVIVGPRVLFLPLTGGG